MTGKTSFFLIGMTSLRLAFVTAVCEQRTSNGGKDRKGDNNYGIF
jgi:hypothetical protein